MTATTPAAAATTPVDDVFRERERPERDQDGRGQRRGTPTPKLFIPYYPGDVGDRAAGFPANVASWWCEGMRIYRPGGSRYLGGTLERNQTSTIVVDVANGGSQPTWAQVAVYWCEPTAGFGPPHLRRGPILGESVSVRVPVGYTRAAPAITLRPDDATPDHICLLASVSALRDAPDGSWTPATDRHYAQHNVDVELVAADQVTTIAFYATNPFPDHAARVFVSLLPAEPELNAALAPRYRAEPAELDPQALRLVDGDEPLEPNRELVLSLEPGERRRCQVLVAPGALPSGQFAAAEILTNATSPHSEEPDREGALGLVLFGA